MARRQMIFQVANRILALTVLAATVATVGVVQARAETTDKAMSSTGPEIDRAASPAPKASTNPGGPVANPILATPLSQLSVTRDRPIFSPSRRPPAAPALPVIAKAVEPAKPMQPETPPLILVGTVAGEDSGIAVFVEQSGENSVRLRLNESHQGWTLQSIQGREVTLLKDQKSSVLALAPPGGNAEPARPQAALEPPRRLPKR
jgi:general secretion pathway protein N